MTPTITRVLGKDCQIQYEYSVGNKTYVTTRKPLFDFCAESIDGRATRVWKVYDKGGDRDVHFALKDIWIFSDTQPEDKVLQELRSHVHKDHHGIFLTIIDDDWVYLDGNRSVVDKTARTIMRRVPTIQGYIRFQSEEEPKQTQPTTLGSSRNQLHSHTPRGSAHVHHEVATYQKEHQFSLRSHHHTIFKEVCKPLHELNNLGRIYWLLQYAVTGKWSSFV